VPPPIATCELQAYWYTAQELMGMLAWIMGARAAAAAFRKSAAALKERFNRDWWVESEQFFALALAECSNLSRPWTLQNLRTSAAH
jgi:glycogen debranching enzyme